MRETQIIKRDNNYQKLYVLKTNRNKRHGYKEFIVEGVRNINGAVQNKWTVVSFVYSRRSNLSSWAKRLIEEVETEVNYALAEELLKELSEKEDSSELMAVCKMPAVDLETIPFADVPIIVLLDRPSNKGNLGTIIRSCEAFGVDLILLTGHGVDVYDPEVIAATMGSFFQIPIVKVETNEELSQSLAYLKDRFADLHLIGTTSHDCEKIQEVDFQRPTLLMIGNETKGLSHGLKKCCEVLATIDMAEGSFASSLNVSCATTTILYEISRQRGGK